MNIYEKLAEAKSDFHKLTLKKTGKNKFAGYVYFELADFVQPLITIFAKHKLTTIFDFGTEKACLTLIDCEKPEDRIFTTCAVSEVNMKGCQPVQNLGAVMTYTRRYLFVNLMDIIEQDIVDSQPPAQPVKVLTKEEIEKKAILKEVYADFKLLSKKEQDAIKRAAGKPSTSMSLDELRGFAVAIAESLAKETDDKAKEAADKLFNK